MQKQSLETRVAAVTALDDPTRRALLNFVVRSAGPVGRDAVAEEFTMPRSTAAFHLDRLVAQGLLEVEFKRLSGRTGPGSGRPAKLYHRAPGEISVSVPERHYDLAANLLVAAVDKAAADGDGVIHALTDAAHQAGAQMAAGASNLGDVLESNGFEPYTQADGSTAMANCPFHQLVANHPDTVCTMNLHLLRGAACACGADPDSLQLDPAPGRCCVTIRPPANFKAPASEG
ncbi:MAG: helix-turn-helix domain-containing protein [Nakamurella sp.]